MIIRNRKYREKAYPFVRKTIVFWTRNRSARVFSVWVLPLLIFFTLYLASNYQKYEFRLYSGTPGGFYELIGKEICRITNETLKGKVNIINDNSTAGSIDNIEKISNNSNSFGLAQDGLPATSKIRSILFLFESPLQVVVDTSLANKDINSLLGKRVYIGKRKSGTEFIAREVFKHYGMDSDDYIRVGEDWSFNDAAKKIVDKKVDAGFFLVASNSDAIEYVASKGGFSLMNISRSSGIARLLPSLNPTEIPKSAYKSKVDFPSQSVKTVATREILVCSKDVPDKLVSAILKTVLIHVSDLVTKYPLTTQVSKIDPQKSFYYPLHPGALAVYQQADSSTFTPSFFLSLLSLLITQLLTARLIPKYFRFRLFFRDLYEIDENVHLSSSKSIDCGKRITALEEKIHAFYIEGKITKDDSERLLKYAQLLSLKIKCKHDAATSITIATSH